MTDEWLADAYIRDIRLGPDRLLYGLTQIGDLFTLKDGDVVTYLSYDECRVQGIIGILPDPKHPGYLYLGTENTQVYYGSLERNFGALGIKDIAPLSYVERFEYIDGQIWICAGNGIGNLDEEGFQLLQNVPMDNSVGHVMTDYAGNLWFTSTRQGVMKVVPNQFADLFDRYKLDPTVVNSTSMLDQQLFIATDSGLIVVENGKTLESMPLTEATTASGVDLDAKDLLEFMDGVRIRSIIRDSQDRIWIATWRKHGLIRYDHGKVTAFTVDDGLFSDRVRVVCECEDGTIMVANTGGVSIIKDDAIIAKYGEESGIVNAEILTVAEGYDHSPILG